MTDRSGKRRAPGGGSAAGRPGRVEISLLKSMGQNFLVDRRLPEKIVDGSGIDGTFGVLEVGPGLGALTKRLCEKAAFVLAVELDKRLPPLLDEALAGYKNVRIISGDILKIDIKGEVLKAMPGLRYAVCANLPYNITTPAITALCGAGIFETITVMVQKEVARRMCANPGSPEYGAFSVFVRYHSEPEVLFDVPPGSFVPRPKVTSSVVRMKMRPSRPDGSFEEEMFFKVVRGAFNQRRKTLLNSLSAAFGGLSKDGLRAAIESCGISPETRPESLGLAEFAALSREIGIRLGG